MKKPIVSVLLMLLSASCPAQSIHHSMYTAVSLFDSTQKWGVSFATGTNHKSGDISHQVAPSWTIFASAMHRKREESRNRPFIRNYVTSYANVGSLGLSYTTNRDRRIYAEFMGSMSRAVSKSTENRQYENWSFFGDLPNTYDTIHMRATENNFSLSVIVHKQFGRVDVYNGIHGGISSYPRLLLMRDDGVRVVKDLHAYESTTIGYIGGLDFYFSRVIVGCQFKTSHQQYLDVDFPDEVDKVEPVKTESPITGSFTGMVRIGVVF
jgi:hypothetical protein